MTKPANIVFLIDQQNGFSQTGLTREQGGSLYVPEGEMTGEAAANLMRQLHDTVFVLSQDYHPKNHISFFDNHSGIAAPFTDIYLRKGLDKRYGAVAAVIGDTVNAVDTKDGYVIAIRDDKAVLQDGDIRQTTWNPHCIQGTPSTLFVEPVMSELPLELAVQLRAHDASSDLAARGGRGNSYHIIRKGTRSDLDSYGISTENDQISKTTAPAVFENIASELGTQGFTKAHIYIGGLATNFCDEFSHQDIYRDFIPLLEKAGITAQVHFLTDISRGIPIQVPGGAWPDLESSQNRMATFGTKILTTDEVLHPRPAGGNRLIKKSEPIL